MTRTEKSQAPRPPRSRDLLSLMSAPTSDLLEELVAVATGNDDTPGVPARSLQLADMLVAEIVRLIRLGTRAQLSRAAEALSDALIDSRVERLAQSSPEAYELLNASASVLVAAVSPSSSGGEIAVLRSWRGRAGKTLSLVARAPEQMVSRGELWEALQELEADGSTVSDSHMSHVLADLEAAGLIERIKTGREVMVHLGPIAHTEHVQRILEQVGVEVRDADEQTIRRVLGAAITDGGWDTDLVGGKAILSLVELHNRVERFRREAASADVSVRSVVGGGPKAIVFVRVTGRLLGGRAALEVVDDELLWSVAVEHGRVVEVTPWNHARGWLGGRLEPEVERSGPAWLASAEEVGLTVDANGEFRITADVLTWLPAGMERAGVPGAAEAMEGVDVSNVEKPVLSYDGRGEPIALRGEPIAVLTELDLEVVDEELQSLR